MTSPPPTHPHTEIDTQLSGNPQCAHPVNDWPLRLFLINMTSQSPPFISDPVFISYRFVRVVSLRCPPAYRHMWLSSITAKYCAVDFRPDWSDDEASWRENGNCACISDTCDKMLEDVSIKTNYLDLWVGVHGLKAAPVLFPAVFRQVVLPDRHLAWKKTNKTNK